MELGVVPLDSLPWNGVPMNWELIWRTKIVDSLNDSKTPTPMPHDQHRRFFGGHNAWWFCSKRTWWSQTCHIYRNKGVRRHKPWSLHKTWWVIIFIFNISQCDLCGSYRKSCGKRHPEKRWLKWMQTAMIPSHQEWFNTHSRSQYHRLFLLWIGWTN